jgi:hypothetical protein
MDGDFAPLTEALDVRLRSPEVRPVVEDDDTLLALHGNANGITRRLVRAAPPRLTLRAWTRTTRLL